MLVETIAKDTGLSRSYLDLLAITASHRYKLYRIPKRTHGERLIAHPARPLKAIQRWLAEYLFSDLPIHDAAFAYREGRSTADNAAVHVERNFLLKLDIKDFFPSLTASDVCSLLKKNSELLKFQLGPEDLQFVQRIVSRKGSLPIGAPSSPILSNQLMFEFDRAVSALCNQREVRFTRYADDMFFSTNEPNVLSEIHTAVASTLQVMNHPKLNLNLEKTVYTSRRRKRIVTGIVLTSDRKMSLGREKKREIRSLLQRYRDANLDLQKAQYLSGFLSYASSVEPPFIVALTKKYGDDLIRRATGKAAKETGMTTPISID
jgi:RNA-directed DNA polymerase